MIPLDTSALIDCLCGQRATARAVRRAIADGERIVLATLVVYEWLRGPRTIEEVAAQEALFLADAAIVWNEPPDIQVRLISIGTEKLPPLLALVPVAVRVSETVPAAVPGFVADVDSNPFQTER